MTNPPSQEPNPAQLAAGENTPPEILAGLAKTSTELARIVAVNPCAPPDLLRELAESSDEATCQNVTANPNTPTDVLLELGSDFPGELLNNVVFSLLLLETPDFVEKVPFQTIYKLLAYEEVPDSFLEWAGNESNEGIILAVAANPKTPKAVLEKLARREHNSQETVRAVRLHVNLAGELTEGGDEIVQQAIASVSLIYKEEEYLPELARMDLIPDWVFQTVLKAEDNLPFVRAIAPHLRDSSLLLKHLGKNSLGSVQDSLIRNENTPQTLLKIFAEDADNKIRALAARHPNATLKILEKLAEDESADVRVAVAENPNTPSQLLEKLAKDRYHTMPVAVAQHSRTPVKILEELARHKNPEVRAKVALNLKTPEKILIQLARDKEGVVREAVAKNPHAPRRILEEFYKENNKVLQEALALNPSTPKRILEKLAENSDFQVRCNVAANPSTPVRILEQLARDEENYVRAKVAANPNTPANILELLAKNEEFVVSENLAKNPNTPARVFEQILPRSKWRIDSAFYLSKHPEVLPAVLEHLAKHFIPSFSRFIVFSHPQTPATTLAKNCRSVVWLERYAIASHANTPLDTLRILTRDGNRVARAAAKVNLQALSSASTISYMPQKNE